MAGRWRLEPCERALAGMEEVERLLDLPLLQRLAMHRACELEILETDEALTIVQVLSHAQPLSQLSHSGCLHVFKGFPSSFLHLGCH